MALVRANCGNPCDSRPKCSRRSIGQVTNGGVRISARKAAIVSARLAPAWKEGSSHRPDPMAARPLPRSAVQQHHSDVYELTGRSRMNRTARLLLAATLLFASG